MILRNQEAKERYEELKASGHILGEFIVGSQSYGTNIETSDIDKQFVYIETLDRVMNATASEKLEITKDYVGFEIKRFLELVRSANPSILDLTSSPEDCIISLSPIYKKYVIDNSKMFLTKKVKESYGKYASGQIKKARGENKKFRQTYEKERKGLLDFCWVADATGQGTRSIKDIGLSELDLSQCSVSNLDHMKNCYNLFTVPGNGVVDKDNVQIVLSSVPKGVEPYTLFYANVEGFSIYCREYKEYWDWEENKNQDRFNDNIANGCLYDSKNMAHCHRLLDTAIEILRDGTLNIRRPNPEQLKAIRKGAYPFEQLMLDADEKVKMIDELYLTTSLPDECPELSDMLLNIRKEFYESVAFYDPLQNM